MTPGEIVRDARRRHGLTQQQLALRAGTTQTAISRLERDAQSPTFETLRNLLLAVGEEPLISTRRLEGDHDPVHLAAERQLEPGARLERAFARTAFNNELLGAARRGGS